MEGNIYRSGIAVNTSAVDYRSGMDMDNGVMDTMDIKAIRLRNLQIVLEEDFGGTKARLAEAMGVPANNISRYFGSNPEHRRSVSDEAARKIEKATGREHGWMDQAHRVGGVDLNAEAQGLSDEKLRILRGFIRSLKEDDQT